MWIESDLSEFSRYKRIQLNLWQNKVRTIWTIDLEKSFGYLQLNKLKCRIVVRFLNQLFCGDDLQKSKKLNIIHREIYKKCEKFEIITKLFWICDEIKEVKHSTNFAFLVVFKCIFWNKNH